MRYDDTRPAFECLRNCVKGQFLRSEAKLRKELETRLNILLEPSKYGPIRKDGWAPIRSGWPTGAIGKRPRNSNQYFKKPRASTGKSAKPAKVPMTAQQVLDSLI